MKSVFRNFGVAFALLAAHVLLTVAAQASDHGDHPVGVKNRDDARITDLYAFVRGEKLVVILTTNPAIPPEDTSYDFPGDLKLRVHIDNHSEVDFTDPKDLELFGGTVVEPSAIRADIVLVVRRSRGKPSFRVKGRGVKKEDVRFLAELRDDPFIRGPRIGRNVAAIVFELPLAKVLGEQSTLLVWATAELPDIPIAEHGGRALRSMFEEEQHLNSLHPSEHGSKPDVLIYNTARRAEGKDPAAEYPNGRELADDVVNIVCNENLLRTDFPCPVENDLPFLAVFPYLPEPHPSPGMPPPSCPDGPDNSCPCPCGR